MRFRKFYENDLLENKLPKGFTEFDIDTVDEFLRNEKRSGNEIDMDINIDEADEPEISDVDIEELKKKRMSGVSKDVDLAKRPEKLLHKSNIVDENGNIVDNDKLKKKITERPKDIIDQNTKIQTSGKSTNQVFYDSTLPSYMGLFVDENTGQFKTVKTCPAAGECSKFCYAAKGGYIMFPTSSLKAARVVNFLMNDPEGFKNQMVLEIKRAQTKQQKKGKDVILRWHDSGDFLSEKYLQLAFDIAKETPEVIHYAYTKQVPLIRRLESEKPENFVFNFSFGGIYDDEINVDMDKHAKVVPPRLFKDLDKKKIDGAIKFSSEAIKKLKDRVSKEFKIKPDTILTYDEMLDTPTGNQKKWNVLVWKGHGDDSAIRKDVLGTYLLFH